MSLAGWSPPGRRSGYRSDRSRSVFLKRPAGRRCETQTLTGRIAARELHDEPGGETNEINPLDGR